MLDYVIEQFNFAFINVQEAHRLMATEQFILRDSLTRGLTEDHENALTMIQAIKQQFIAHGIHF